MAKVSQIDRRKSRSTAFKLDRPLFTKIPRSVAAPVLLACAVTAFLASNFVSPAIGFGPIYLLLCAFSAWFVGIRFAIALCVLGASLQFLNGAPIIFRNTELINYVNSALQLCSALAVVT